MTMPSPTDAISTGLRFSLAGSSRKVGNDSNGEPNSLDSALAAGNKLAEITKHHVEYESSDNQQSNTQNVLKSKYIVLDTKVCFPFILEFLIVFFMVKLVVFSPLKLSYILSILQKC